MITPNIRQNIFGKIVLDIIAEHNNIKLEYSTLNLKEIEHIAMDFICWGFDILDFINTDNSDVQLSLIKSYGYDQEIRENYLKQLKGEMCE